MTDVAEQFPLIQEPYGVNGWKVPVSCRDGGVDQVAFQTAVVELTTADDWRRVVIAAHTLTRLGFDPADIAGMPPGWPAVARG